MHLNLPGNSNFHSNSCPHLPQLLKYYSYWHQSSVANSKSLILKIPSPVNCFCFIPTYIYFCRNSHFLSVRSFHFSIFIIIIIVFRFHLSIFLGHFILLTNIYFFTNISYVKVYLKLIRLYLHYLIQ